ncbi:sensor histidine kinase [Aquipuribacter hungaricus]|uniref:histidine kinase n=1 Tax=Aquipuribacter hungaricus TaxID=545624 RepID=A0ABV7WDF6_9MICO
MPEPGGTAPVPPAPPQGARPGSGVSLELRLVLIVVLAVTVATMVVGAALVVEERRQLVERVDAQLRATALTLAQATADELAGPVQEGRRVSLVADIPSEYVVVVFVESRDTTVEVRPVVRSRGGMPAVPELSSSEAAARGSEPFTVGSQQGVGRWRVVSLPTDSGDASVSVALPLDADDATKRLSVVTLVIGSAVVAVAALLGGVAVRRSLRPLTAVEHTAVAIARGELSARVPEGGQDTEVGRLTGALNGMLARIEDSIRQREASQDRMRRFVADASHELRTPLASIRGFAELHRQGAVPQDEVAPTFARIEAEARRLGVLVDDLLLLAKLDEQRPVQRTDVDLAVLALDAGGDVRALDPTRRVTVRALDGSGVAPVHVVGDPDRLRQVITNLVGNAVRHTPRGTPVELAVGTAPGPAAVLEVRDHGPGIPVQERARVFDRFSRLDASRHRGTGGTGLGLSIVAAVVAGHGGRVEVDDTPGGGATFRVLLPAPVPSPTDHAATDQSATDEATTDGGSAGEAPADHDTADQVPGPGPTGQQPPAPHAP